MAEVDKTQRIWRIPEVSGGQKSTLELGHVPRLIKKQSRYIQESYHIYNRGIYKSRANKYINSSVINT